MDQHHYLYLLNCKLDNSKLDNRKQRGIQRRKLLGLWYSEAAFIGGLFERQHCAQSGAKDLAAAVDVSFAAFDHLLQILHCCFALLHPYQLRV